MCFTYGQKGLKDGRSLMINFFVIILLFKTDFTHILFIRLLQRFYEFENSFDVEFEQYKAS